MKPAIRQGLGALTPSTWQQIYQAVAAVGTNIIESDHVLMDRFSARITASASISDNKYAYSWHRNRQTAGGSTNTWTDGEEIGGLQQDQYARAINLLEGGNTASSAYGYSVNANGDLVGQSGFRISPVPNGTVVMMHALRGLDGIMSFQFSAPNPITGACPTPLTATIFDEGTYPLPSLEE